MESLAGGKVGVQGKSLKEKIIAHSYIDGNILVEGWGGEGSGREKLGRIARAVFLSKWEAVGVCAQMEELA